MKTRLKMSLMAVNNLLEALAGKKPANEVKRNLMTKIVLLLIGPAISSLPAG